MGKNISMYKGIARIRIMRTFESQNMENHNSKFSLMSLSNTVTDKKKTSAFFIKIWILPMEASFAPFNLFKTLIFPWLFLHVMGIKQIKLLENIILGIIKLYSWYPPMKCVQEFKGKWNPDIFVHPINAEKLENENGESLSKIG